MRPQRFLMILPALAFITVASYGCDGDPLADEAAKPNEIEVNRAATFQVVGGPFSVAAAILDPLRARIPTRLDATTNRPETLRIDSVVFVTELRETRVFATPLRLDTIGAEITLTGGGLSKTVAVSALPGGLDVSLVTELGSGDTAQITVQGLNRDGEPFGPVPFRVTDVSDANVVSVTPEGQVVGQGVGLATITITGPGGAIRATADVEVVPGTFRGTATQAPVGAGGQALIIEAGPVSFDDDTRVVIGGVEAPFIIAQSETSITALIPFPTPAGATTLTLERVGPNQLALSTSINLTAVTDIFEPNDDEGSAAVLTPGTDVYASVSAADIDDVFVFTVTGAPATFDFELDWAGGADIDVWVLVPGGAFNDCGPPAPIDQRDLLGCRMWTGNHPERATGITLAPGTYYVYVNVYEADGISTYRLRVTPN